MEKELLETRQKAEEAGRQTTAKAKPLWREKMALTTEELRLKNKHQAWLDYMKLMTTLIAEEYKEASSQDMGDGKDEFIASYEKARDGAARAVDDFDRRFKALHKTWADVLASATTSEACEAALTMLKDHEQDGVKDLVASRKLAKQRLLECKGMVASLMKQIVSRAQAGDAKVVTKKIGAQAHPSGFW